MCFEKVWEEVVWCDVNVGVLFGVFYVIKDFGGVVVGELFFFGNCFFK